MPDCLKALQDTIHIGLQKFAALDYNNKIAP
jgi:hypothetical protein